MSTPCPCATCGKPATIGTKEQTILCLDCHRNTPGYHHSKNDAQYRPRKARP